MTVLIIHPLARRDLRKATAWYAQRSPRAAVRLIRLVREAILEISFDPIQYAKSLFGTRSCALRTFPYSIVYYCDDFSVRIVAVAHAKRRPGYWRRRLRHP